MRKLLLFAMGAMMAMPSFAQEQEEDMTYLIKNAGFDEDLTFQADGSMKEAIKTDHSLSDRSWAYIAADSTVYARPKSTSSQNRPDGRKMEAVNGFKGRIQGWKLWSNANFPQCEWTYFGSVAYDLPATAVPIADDGSTYLAVPARPTEFDGGTGFVYLRAGWTNSATFSQEVELPCAKYRLEYWTININPNTSAVAQDLTQIKCRNDVFKDEEGTGLQAKVWTKHEFEFTPTARFTMQFGYQAANAGSGGQPIVALDGIKLYKIGEADRADILQAMVNECNDLAGLATAAGYDGLAGQIGDYSFELEGIDTEDADAFAAAIDAADAVMEKFKAALAEMENVDAMLAKMDKIMQTTDYPGKADFQTAFQRILYYKEGPYTGEGEDFAAWILGAVEEGNAAIRAYNFTQVATVDNPADYTFLVKSPWFIKETAQPENVDGEYIFPNAEKYTEGSSNDDLTSEGWKVTGTYTGGDQRLNWQRNRSCWNAWGSGINGTIAVGQTIEGLPNGYYTVSADLITQTECLTDQHVYAESTAEKKISSSLTKEGWDGYEWETLSMTADQKVLVVDGVLTIGAEGTGTGSGSAGWFLATNFKLNYLGEASADALKAAYDAKVLAANELANKMHFAADKKALNDTIAKYSASTDYISALGALTAAIKEAQTSEAKYEEYMQEGKTLPTIAETLARNGGAGYKAAEAIAEFAYDFSMNWIASDAASYLKIDSIVNHTKSYVNDYIPVYNAADSVANEAQATGKTALQQLMAAQKAVLIGEMQLANVVTEYIKALNDLMAMVNKQNIVDDENAKDYTAFIQNPNIEKEDGWSFVRGNGDKNTTSGQWFDGTSTRYIDSYHSSKEPVEGTNDSITVGLVGFKAWQLVKDLPNGTYKVGVYTRTPAEGAYIFNSVAAADTAFTEIPLHYYLNDESQEVIASDKRGPLWEEAKAAIDAGMSETDPLYAYYSAIYNANNGEGRGWKHQEMDVTVTNHELTIGVKSGVAGENEKAFTGGWFSAGGWTLTLVELGNNEGWNGPIAEGIESVVNTANAQIEGIYTLTGAKVNKLQRGLNIVVRNGKAIKVMVK
ncbi:MAG: hypothetical protein J6M41_11590 [Prevotella sp.]|nr:hypothetical protein [Prevotella sp.]